MKRLIILLCLFILFFILAVTWWNNGQKAVNIADTGSKMFVIRPETNVREISSLLKKEGLIKDPVVFFLLVKKLGIEKNIQAGDYLLSPSLSALDVARSLTKGVVDIWVTIPEGKRAEEIAEILKEKIPSYKDSWKEILASHEGYLFPDTYLIPKDASIQLIANLLQNTFAEKYLTLKPSTTNLSKEEIVILASLIEREARHPEDRPLVSSVIHNRLDSGMALQIDATVQYALGFNANDSTWWKKELTASDLKIDSAYNTYINVGLPPSPIANPGLAALVAAAHPANTNYYYYITDKKLINHYARTNAEHIANIQKYGL